MRNHERINRVELEKAMNQYYAFKNKLNKVLEIMLPVDDHVLVRKGHGRVWVEIRNVNLAGMDSSALVHNEETGKLYWVNVFPHILDL